MKHGLLVTALALALAVPAFAGGENCDKTAEHKAAHKTAHKADAVKAMKANGWIGLDVDATDEQAGYVITKVYADSPAYRAGLREGDVLVAYQGVRFTADNEKALKKAKKSQKVGSRVSYTVARAGAEREVTLTTAAVPEAVLAQWQSRAEEEARIASVDQ